MQGSYVAASVAALEIEDGWFIVGIADKWQEPAFFRNAKAKFKIDVKFDLERMTLEACHNNEVVAVKKMKGQPTYDDYCELFITAVKMLAKRHPIIIGYSFILG